MKLKDMNELKKDTRELRTTLKDVLNKVIDKKMNLIRANTINYTANNILRSIDLEMKMNKKVDKS